VPVGFASSDKAYMDGLDDQEKFYSPFSKSHSKEADICEFLKY
jgi:hypothetical protein